MVELLSDVSTLDLGNLITDRSGVTLLVLSVKSIHHFDIDLDRLVKEATRLDNHVIFEKVS